MPRHNGETSIAAHAALEISMAAGLKHEES